MNWLVQDYADGVEVEFEVDITGEGVDIIPTVGQQLTDEGPEELSLCRQG